jgi:hypothetical protein
MRMDITADIDWTFEDGDANHEFCKKEATFTHKDACEFIVHIGHDINQEDSHYNRVLASMKTAGCSEAFMDAYREAGELGAVRALFYC